MSYGVPYKGSKNLIAAKLAEAIPSADNFYDLFAGVCGVSHRMMETGRFKRISSTTSTVMQDDALSFPTERYFEKKVKEHLRINRRLYIFVSSNKKGSVRYVWAEKD